jgi:hypothetical protein
LARILRLREGRYNDEENESVAAYVFMYVRMPLLFPPITAVARYGALPADAAPAVSSRVYNLVSRIMPGLKLAQMAKMDMAQMFEEWRVQDPVDLPDHLRVLRLMPAVFCGLSGPEAAHQIRQGSGDDDPERSSDCLAKTTTATSPRPVASPTINVLRELTAMHDAGYHDARSAAPAAHKLWQCRARAAMLLASVMTRAVAAARAAALPAPAFRAYYRAPHPPRAPHQPAAGDALEAGRPARRIDFGALDDEAGRASSLPLLRGVSYCGLGTAGEAFVEGVLGGAGEFAVEGVEGVELGMVVRQMGMLRADLVRGARAVLEECGMGMEMGMGMGLAAREGGDATGARDAAERDLWLWKAFSGAFYLRSLRKTPLADQGTAARGRGAGAGPEATRYDVLCGDMERLVGRWSAATGVRRWEEARAALARVAWPDGEDRALDGVARGIWERATWENVWPRVS